MDFKDEFAEILYSYFNEQLDKKKLSKMIEKPKFEKLGDMAFPCFDLAKLYRKSPNTIAMKLADSIESSLFEKVEAVGGYVNVFLDKNTVSVRVIKEILSKKDHYGDLNLGIKCASIGDVVPMFATKEKRTEFISAHEVHGLHIERAT